METYSLVAVFWRPPMTLSAVRVCNSGMSYKDCVVMAHKRVMPRMLSADGGDWYPELTDQIIRVQLCAVMDSDITALDNLAGWYDNHLDRTAAGRVVYIENVSFKQQAS